MVNCSSCNNDVNVDRNRNLNIKVTLQVDEEAFPITGAKIWSSVKKEMEDLDSEALILKRNAAAGGADTEAEVTDGPNGILYIYIKPEDTVDIGPGDYWWDVVIETSAGRKLQAVHPSRFSIKQPVTLAE